MKNIKSISLVAVAAMGLLAGCGGNGEGGDSGTKIGHFTKEVTIKFTQGFAGKYQPQIQAFINGFKEVEPLVTVDISGWVSANYDQIHKNTVADITGGTGEYGDLVLGYGDHAADYMNYNKLVQWDQYIDHPEYGLTAAEKDDYIQGFFDEGRSLPIQGTWLMPFSKSTEAMFYNADVLEGLDLSTYDNTINGGNPLNENYLSNLTWEEIFEKLCPAFEKYDAEHTDAPLIIRKETDGLNSYFGYDGDANLFITLSQQYGYGYTSIDQVTGEAQLDFNNDNMKGLVKTFATAANKGYLRTAGCAKANNSYCSSLFLERNCLFCVGSTAGVTNQVSSDFVVKVAPVPQAKGHDKKIISQGPGVVILDHGDEDRKLASWLFYKYLTNPTNSATWAKTVGYLPVRQSSYSDEEYFDYCNPQGKTAGTLEYLQALNASYSSKYSQYCYSTASFTGSSTARNEVGSLLLNTLIAAKNGTTIDDEYLDNAFNTAINNIKKDM